MSRALRPLRASPWLTTRRGSILVEFTLIFPFLLSLAVAVWEFGHILDALLVVTNAAREGARYAVATTPRDPATFPNQVRDRVMAYLADGYGARIGPGGDIIVDRNQIRVEFFDDNGNPGPPLPGYRVVVTVPVQVRVIIQGLAPGLDAPTVSLAGQATMRLE
jgi:hypothetical protein